MNSSRRKQPFKKQKGTWRIRTTGGIFRSVPKRSGKRRKKNEWPKDKIPRAMLRLHIALFVGCTSKSSSGFQPVKLRPDAGETSEWEEDIGQDTSRQQALSGHLSKGEPGYLSPCCMRKAAVQGQCLSGRLCAAGDRRIL